MIKDKYTTNFKGAVLLTGAIAFVFLTSGFRFFNKLEGHTSSYPDTEKFILKTGNISMTISKNGARITSFRLGDKELLTQSEQSENYGSTFWLAPQSNWGWPPYPTLDISPYEVLIHQDTLIFNSLPDEKSGCSMSKRFYVQNSDSSILIEYKIRNISQKTLSVGAWEVTRVPCDGVAFFPKGEKAVMPKSNLASVDTSGNITWFNAYLNEVNDAQKLYASAGDGWLAFMYKDMFFVKQFPDVQASTLPPEQGEVEIFADAKRRYIELENHGSYISLLPGESLVYKVKWLLKKLPSNVDFNNKNSIKIYIHNTLHI